MHAERQLFRQRRIFVDFGSFHHCTFEGCTLVYSAAGPYHFDHCDFLDVRWEFAGAAHDSLFFLADLAKLPGGRTVIENVMSSVLPPAAQPSASTEIRH